MSERAERRDLGHPGMGSADGTATSREAKGHRDAEMANTCLRPL